MSEWKNKSDAEINMSVEKLTGMYCEDVAGKYTPTCNYCNNPSDAWNIIIENKISINHGMTLISDGDYKWHENWFCGNGKGIDCQDKNPLRAAMIVFLEMNGVKP